MKIAILGSRGIPARYGGFETFAEELATRLVKRGVEVTVYCEARDDRPASYKGVHLRYLDVPSAGPLTTILFDLFCLRDARRSFDVVYMLGYGASAFCFIPRLWGRKVWINMDGLEWKRSKWSRLAKAWLMIMETFATLTPNRLIADAQSIKDLLCARHRRLPPCTVIPYGAPVLPDDPDKTPLSAYGLAPGEYYLSVCRLEPENHILEVLKGFRASAARYPLVVVGNHRLRSAYIDALEREKNARIRFVGPIYDRAVLQSIRYYCTACFHGHSVGGTNPSLLEVLGCGNVILAHDNPFNREVAGGLALYFKTEHDIPALIAAVEGYSGEDRARHAREARLRVEESYSWESVVAKYVDLAVMDCK